jgi:hypothetical protein
MLCIHAYTYTPFPFSRGTPCAHRIIPPIPTQEILLLSLANCSTNWQMSYELSTTFIVPNRRMSTGFDDSSFYGKRHLREMGAVEIEQFLTHLAVKESVAASTQTQALCALLFLFKHLLKMNLPALDAVRAKRPKRLPVVLSRLEVS